ncbi:MAG: TVP38/TMEM64 family protein [Streptosporangiaceae bacterium]
MQSAPLRFGLLVTGAATAAGLAAFLLPDRDGLVRVVESAGPLGPVLAVAGTSVLILAMFPRTALAFVGGLLFGVGPGALYALVGAMIGASVAFWLGRALGRDLIDLAVRSAEDPGMGGRIARWVTKADSWLGRHGILGVLTLRLLPIAPYGLMSYAFGTSATRYRNFLLGSLIGATPTTFGYAALGAAVLGPGAVPTALAVISGLGLLSVTSTIALRRFRSPVARNG